MWIKREEYERLLDDSQRYWSSHLELTQRRVKAAEYIQKIIDLQDEVDTLRKGRNYLNYGRPLVPKPHKHNLKVQSQVKHPTLVIFSCADCIAHCIVNRDISYNREWLMIKTDLN